MVHPSQCEGLRRGLFEHYTPDIPDVVDTIELPAGAEGLQIAIDRNDKYAYVGDEQQFADNTIQIHVIDVSNYNFSIRFIAVLVFR